MRFLLAASCFFLGLTSWANPRIKQPLIARDDSFLAAESSLAAVLSLQTAAVVTTQAVSEATRVDEGASEESSSKLAVLVVSYWSLGCWEHGGVNVVEFFYHGSQVIAIGLKHPSGDVTWTHAIGRGPLGPCFLKDLTGQGNDYFIFTDHLGTPFAWHDPDSGLTYYTPFNPWGELLAAPTSGYTPYEHGNVPTSGFNLPTFEVFDVTPLGLAGHIYDEKTGLVYMHHRYLHPRLGHFLTPDFRAPNIYDPSTFTEPYAYAGGNPIMYWDPDGLALDYYHTGKRVEPKNPGVDATSPVKAQPEISLLGRFLRFLTGNVNLSENSRDRWIDAGLRRRGLDEEDDPEKVDFYINILDEQFDQQEAVLDTYVAGFATAEVCAVSAISPVVDLAVVTDDAVAYGPSWYQAPALLPFVIPAFSRSVRFVPKTTPAQTSVAIELVDTTPGFSTIRHAEVGELLNSLEPPTQAWGIEPQRIVLQPGQIYSIRSIGDVAPVFMMDDAANTARSFEQPRNALGQFMSRNPGQVTPGISAVDDFVAQAQRHGYVVRGREVTVQQSPFGGRRYDLVLENPQTRMLSGVEIKSSRSAFERFDAPARQQFAADRWLNLRGGAQAVGQYKDLFISDSIKILWEVP